MSRKLTDEVKDEKKPKSIRMRDTTDADRKSVV